MGALLAGRYSYDPILPATGERVWAALSIVLLASVVLAMVLAAPQVLGIRRAADAARQAAAAEAEVRARREELRGTSK